MFSSIKKILGSCVYIVKSCIYPVCVNIPIVELLLSWLSLFYLSRIINNLLPVSMPSACFVFFIVTVCIFVRNSCRRVKSFSYFAETNRGGCWSNQEILKYFNALLELTCPSRYIRLMLKQLSLIESREVFYFAKFTIVVFNQMTLFCFHFF